MYNVSSLSNSKEDFIDIEKQVLAVHRESEGQDTITPLTNAKFLKQLNKLKHYESSRSINSNTSLSSNTSYGNNLNANGMSNPNNDTLSEIGSTKSSLTRNIQGKLLSFFGSFKNSLSASTSVAVSKNNVSEFVDQLNQLDCKLDQNQLRDHITFKINSVADEETENTDLLNKSFNLNHSSKTSLTHFQTDQVYDALSMAINNPNNNIVLDKKFIEDVRIIVQQSELIKKRQIDKSIFICKVLITLFFLFIFSLVVLFFITLNSIANNFLNVHFYKNNLNQTSLFSQFSYFHFYIHFLR